MIDQVDAPRLDDGFPYVVDGGEGGLIVPAALNLGEELGHHQVDDAPQQLRPVSPGEGLAERGHGARHEKLELRVAPHGRLAYQVAQDTQDGAFTGKEVALDGALHSPADLLPEPRVVAEIGGIAVIGEKLRAGNRRGLFQPGQALPVRAGGHLAEKLKHRGAAVARQARREGIYLPRRRRDAPRRVKPVLREEKFCKPRRYITRAASILRQEGTAAPRQAVDIIEIEPFPAEAQEEVRVVPGETVEMMFQGRAVIEIFYYEGIPVEEGVGRPERRSLAAHGPRRDVMEHHGEYLFCMGSDVVKEIEEVGTEPRHDELPVDVGVTEFLDQL